MSAVIDQPTASGSSAAPAGAQSDGSALKRARDVLEGPQAQDPTVRLVVQRLDATGLWWIPSRNEDGRAVMTCGDAIKARERVGSGANGGIPQWAELKSMLGVVVDGDSRSHLYVAAHTRANTQFDRSKVLATLGFDLGLFELRPLVRDFDKAEAARDREPEPRSGSDVELDKNEAGWFGRINPFDVDLVIADLIGEPVDIADVVQIVDGSIDFDGGIPNTVMTNLGDRTLALEIHAPDLVTAITSVSPRSLVADIAVADRIWLGLEAKTKDNDEKKDKWLDLPPPRGPKVGILTGNGAESGRALWTDISDALKQMFPFVPDVLAPSVVVNSVPAMGLSMELVDREPEVRAVVLDGVRDLLDAGCRLITLACNTTIYFADEVSTLCAWHGAEFVSIADACLPAILRAVNKSGVGNKVGLIGIGAVVDKKGGYSGYIELLESHGLEPIACAADDLAFAVKSQKSSREFVTDFTRLMQKKFANDVKVVVLGLTEVSMVYRRSVAEAPAKRQPTREYVDPLGELGRFLALQHTLRGYLDSPVCQITDAERVEARLKERLGWP